MKGAKGSVGDERREIIFGGDWSKGKQRRMHGGCRLSGRDCTYMVIIIVILFHQVMSDD